jgi:hypothetical protein
MSLARTADITSGALASVVNASNAVEPRPAAAAESVFPDRPRAVTPCGTSHNRNAAATTRPARRTERSNPVAHTAESKNSRELALSADPRAPPAEPAQRQLAGVQWARQPAREMAPALRRAPPAESIADTAGSGLDGTPCPGPWHANARPPATLATSSPPGGRHHCNNDNGDGWAEMFARTL